MNIPRSKILEALIERESYWLTKRIERWYREKRKYAIFTVGPTGRDFYTTLVNDYKIEVCFFIDNNPALAGTEVYGKKIMFEPWKSDPNFSKEYAIIICSSFEYNNQIQVQLQQDGITEFMTHWQYHDSLNFKQYRSLAATFDDELSKLSYYATIYNRFTGEKKFIQFRDRQYFNHIEFSIIANKIIVDGGAFTGDTTKQFLRSGMFSNKVYAFEPNEDFCHGIQKMWNRLKEENCCRSDLLTIVQSGIGAKSGYYSFSVNNSSMLRINTELKNGNAESIPGGGGAS